MSKLSVPVGPDLRRDVDPVTGEVEVVDVGLVVRQERVAPRGEARDGLSVLGRQADLEARSDGPLQHCSRLGAPSAESWSSSSPSRSSCRSRTRRRSRRSPPRASANDRETDHERRRVHAMRSSFVAQRDDTAVSPIGSHLKFRPWTCSRSRPGLWRWTAYHEEWKEDVGCVYVETEDGVVLIDPLVPPTDTAKFWKALDRDVKRAKGPRARPRHGVLAHA